MTQQAIDGRWKCVSSERFDDYMAAVGVPIFVRMIAANVQVTLVIKVDGNRYQCRQESAFNTTELNFTLDEEFVETTPDGRKFNTTCTLEDGKVVQRQKAINPSDKDSTITRFIENDRLVTILECGEVNARREYERQSE
ncbi:unnamed protein product, partial [Mesorhabditis belari]|uniref:Lipocalin/cytosolic fatty-acid binding domain-containing protein n=1 Tax=Mesorhabditis belari TaxID=2138241 RepID=A0AAF3F898_9BILA